MDAASKLEVLRHDSHTHSVEGAQWNVQEEAHQVSAAGAESTKGRGWGRGRGGGGGGPGGTGQTQTTAGEAGAGGTADRGGRNEGEEGGGQKE